MMKSLLKISLVLSVLLFACKGEKTMQNTEENDLVVEKPDREKADWSFLTADLFHYTAIIKVKEDVPKESYEGKWIDLHDDWTYEGGMYEETTTAGTWDYNHDTKIFRMTPVNGDKVTEWRLLHNNDRVVMAGTTTYGDNATQMRWNRAQEKPSAPVE